MLRSGLQESMPLLARQRSDSTAIPQYLLFEVVTHVALWKRCRFSKRFMLCSYSDIVIPLWSYCHGHCTLLYIDTIMKNYAQKLMRCVGCVLFLCASHIWLLGWVKYANAITAGQV